MRHTWATSIDAERGRCVLWLPVFMGIGVLVYYALRTEPPPWLGAKFAAAGFAAALATASWIVPRGIALAAGFAALGFASAQFATARAPPVATDIPAKAIVVTGRVAAVEVMPQARRVTLRTEAWARPIRFRLKTGDTAAIATGDIVRVRVMLRAPQPPAMPGGWDTQRDAFYAGLGASGYALGPVEILLRAPPDRLAAWIRLARETIAARVAAVLPGPSGAVAVTLLTGSSVSMPEGDHAAFRDSGLAHLLAVAGLHIGIVMGFAFGTARIALALSERACLFWPTKQIAAVFALAAGGAYLVLTGAHVPIVRSFAMACLVTLAILAGRPPVSLRGLAFAATVLMLIAPNEVPGVSFQMSFSAVLALISGYEALRPWLRQTYARTPCRRLLSHVIALALTSTLAGTASLPFGAYHFGQVQIYYIVSNMAAVPLTALLVMPAGMIGLMLMPLGLEALAFVPMGWGADLIIGIARATASLPAATVPVPHMPPWGLAVLSLGLAWLGIWRSRARLAGLIAIAAGTASPAFDRPPDILISGDARLIGFRTEDGVFLQELRGQSRFTRDAWLHYWAVTRATPVPAEGWAAHGRIACVKDACVFRPRPSEMAALLVRGPAKPNGCGGAAVVVSADPARGVCAWPPPRPVDRFTVWKDGPVAIWLEPTGARVVTDRDERGARPWVPPKPKPRPRPVPDLPLAQRDRGA